MKYNTLSNTFLSSLRNKPGIVLHRKPGICDKLLIYQPTYLPNSNSTNARVILEELSLAMAGQEACIY